MAVKKNTTVKKPAAKKPAARKTTTKKTESVKVEDVKKETVPKAKVKTLFSHIEYCNLVDSSESTKFVADLKFKGQPKKTEAEWKKLFKSEGLI